MRVERRNIDRVRITHNWKVLVILLILIFLLFVVLFNLKIKMQEEEEERKIKCFSDEDCVSQRITCCPCSSGGQEVCMTKTNSSLWQKELEKCEKDLICLQVYNCEERVCKCIEGVCV